MIALADAEPESRLSRVAERHQISIIGESADRVGGRTA
jgi:hypothetical protein